MSFRYWNKWADTTAPRDPAAGATPAREETALRDVVRQQIKNVGLVASNYRTLGATEWGEAEENAERLIMAAVAAALRDRDAAREDAARLDWLEAEGVQSIYLGEGRQLNPASQCLRAAIDAARAAAAEGRAP